MSNEKKYAPLSGYVMITIILFMLIVGIGGLIMMRAPLLILTDRNFISVITGFLFSEPQPVGCPSALWCI